MEKGAIRMNIIDSLEQFKTMLQKYPDDTNYTFDFYRFFKSLTLSGTESIPFIELGTILKAKKPFIFFDMRKQFGHNNVIDVVTSVAMDLVDAEKNIEIIMDSKNMN